MKRTERIIKELSEIKSMLTFLMNQNTRNGSPAWITPDQAAMITSLSRKYLIDNRTSLGLVTSQKKKGGSILFDLGSVQKLLETNSNRKFIES